MKQKKKLVRDDEIMPANKTQYGSLKLASLIIVATMITACSKDDSPVERPPVQVDIIEAVQRPSPNIFEFLGRVQAVRTAEVRARVNGVVERRLYNEGVDVAEGQSLFQIDQRELGAKLNSVNASLNRAKATQANAAKDVARFKGLVASRAISEQEYDAAVSRLRIAEADVAQFKAQQESAELSLSFTTVTSPISGRAGRAQVTEGALVSSTAATLMTTVEQLDPVYVNFSQSSADVLRTRREVADGTLEIPELQRISVELILEDGTLYNQTGHLDFFNFSVDEATGTIAVRAEFPNPEQLLVPGQFVQARILAGVRPDSILIPQRAIQLTSQGATVVLVGKDNIIETRAVTLGELSEGSWRIKTGLKGGEKIVVNGLQKIRPGQAVDPKAYILKKDQIESAKLSNNQSENQSPAEQSSDEVTQTEASPTVKAKVEEGE